MTAAPATNHLVLLGPMGAGKSTVGRLLAATLECHFYDSDTEIERAMGRTSRQIAATEGVAALHVIEAEVFLVAIRDPVPAVVAAAASVVDDEACLVDLAGQTCVLLETPAEVLADRTEGPGHRRQTSTEERAALLRRRENTWRRISAVIIDTSQTSPAGAVEQILEGL
jgi:shikimate kinase